MNRLTTSLCFDNLRQTEKVRQAIAADDKSDEESPSSIGQGAG